MSLRKPLVAAAAIMAAVAVTAPATASAATVPTARTAAVPLSLTCPIWYGLPNPATGTCLPYWMYYYHGPFLP